MNWKLIVSRSQTLPRARRSSLSSFEGEREIAARADAERSEAEVRKANKKKKKSKKDKPDDDSKDKTDKSDKPEKQEKPAADTTD